MKNKFNLLIGLLFLSFMVFSCSEDHTGNSDGSSDNSEYNSLKNVNTPVTDYAFEDMRIDIGIELLKVPKRIRAMTNTSDLTNKALDCSFGFGFCITISIDWDAIQAPHLGGVDPITTGENQVIAVYKPDETTGTVTFYFPNDLTSLDQFSEEDIQEFTIFEDLEIAEGMVLKPGDYPLQYDSLGNLAYVVDMY